MKNLAAGAGVFGGVALLAALGCQSPPAPEPAETATDSWSQNALAAKYLVLELQTLPDPAPTDPNLLPVALIIRNMAPPEIGPIKIYRNHANLIIEKNGQRLWDDDPERYAGKLTGLDSLEHPPPLAVPPGGQVEIVRRLGDWWDAYHAVIERPAAKPAPANLPVGVYRENPLLQPGAYRLYYEWRLQTGPVDPGALANWFMDRQANGPSATTTTPPENFIVLRSNAITFMMP